ncbi:MAG TPA: helix-turn-helix transcriptional regulator [Armatimonadota bacterium]
MTRFDYSTTADGQPITVCCTLLEDGCYTIPADITYRHPAPTFSRMFLFRTGGCQITAGETTYALTAGRLYLLPIGYSFTVRYDGGSELHYVHLHIRDGQGLEIAHRLPGITELTGAAHLAPDIFHAGRAQENWAAQLCWQSAVFQAVIGMCRPLLPALAQQRRQTSRYQALLSALQAHCSADLTVAALAEGLGISASALSKGFRRDVGVSLSAYMARLLMQRACDLLHNTELQIQQIAEALGYRDPYYFHRVFKQHIGSSPRQYRQAVRLATFQR